MGKDRADVPTTKTRYATYVFRKMSYLTNNHVVEIGLKELHVVVPFF